MVIYVRGDSMPVDLFERKKKTSSKATFYGM